jgi:hypothetical protein
MLSIERVKELLKNSELTDEQVERVRDEFYLLAEVIYEQWRHQQD